MALAQFALPAGSTSQEGPTRKAGHPLASPGTGAALPSHQEPNHSTPPTYHLRWGARWCTNYTVRFFVKIIFRLDRSSIYSREFHSQMGSGSHVKYILVFHELDKFTRLMSEVFPSDKENFRATKTYLQCSLNLNLCIVNPTFC